MKNYVLVALFALLSFFATAQDLDFNSQTPIYPNAAISHSYPVVGTPATKVDINVTGSTSNFAGTTQPRPRSNGLQSQVNFSSNTQCVTFTITFSPGVTNLTFSLDEIDRGQANGTTPETYNFVDKVTVSGSIAGTNVTPTIGSDSKNGNTVSGNVITGTNGTTGSSNNVTFAYADVITIVYCSGSDAQPDPLGQSMTIGDMSWDTPLPVNLKMFTAATNMSGIDLFWETSEEVNNDYFEVQKSNDAISFETIKRVDGKNTTTLNSSYYFTDLTPYEGINYYRLSQRDLDGSINYSKIIAHQYFSGEPLLLAYPNPLPQNETLKINSREIDKSTITILNQAGQLVPIQLDEIGSELFLKLPTSTSGGIFYLNGVSGNGIARTQRIVVQ